MKAHCYAEPSEKDTSSTSEATAVGELEKSKSLSDGELDDFLAPEDLAAEEHRLRASREAAAGSGAATVSASAALPGKK